MDVSLGFLCISSINIHISFVSKQDMPLNIPTYKCDNCGLELDRDFNAALNIRNGALRQRFNLTPTVGTMESHASGDMIFVGRSADEAAESLVRR
jgi:hypothetical protein